MLWFGTTLLGTFFSIVSSINYTGRFSYLRWGSRWAEPMLDGDMNENTAPHTSPNFPLLQAEKLFDNPRAQMAHPCAYEF